MTEGERLPERAFEAHEAFERVPGEGFAPTTTTFDGRVTAEEGDDRAFRYTVTVRVPMLSTVVEGEVGPAVEDGWFETLELRLEDAAGATRYDVDLAEYALEREDGTAVGTFVFEWADPDSAPAVAKAVFEYVEGTYLDGVVPGYEYGDPVAGMLAQARDADGEGTGGPMPL